MQGLVGGVKVELVVGLDIASEQVVGEGSFGDMVVAVVGRDAGMKGLGGLGGLEDIAVEFAEAVGIDVVSRNSVDLVLESEAEAEVSDSAMCRVDRLGS